MSSLVTDVLTMSGKLNKNSVTCKVKELEGRVRDLKEGALEKLGSWYVKMTPVNGDTTNLTKEVKEILSEVAGLNELVDKQLKQQLVDTVSEVKERREELREMGIVLEAVRELVSIHEGLKKVDQHIKNSNYKEAADAMNEVKAQFSNRKMPENGIPILECMSARIYVQRERLTYDLDETWKNNVQFQDSGVLIIKNQATIKTVIEEMEHFGTFTKRLNLFGKKCLKELLTPLLFHGQPSVQKVKDGHGDDDSVDNLCIKVAKGNKTDVPGDPQRVFKHLTLVLQNLYNSFMSHRLSRGPTVMRLFGDLIGTELCELIIQETLAPAVPSDNQHLEAFVMVQQYTDRFQGFLCEIDFLPEDKNTIVSFAKNVDMLFINKRCQAILRRARELMKKPLHETVTEETKSDQDPLLEMGIQAMDKGDHLNPKQPLHHVFGFPTCQISSSTKEIVKLIDDVMKEAIESEAVCAARLYTTARNVLDLYCQVVPIYHKENLEALPQQSALCHNNCMYLSHQVLTLLPQYQKKLPSPLKEHPLTLTEVFQDLRVVAMDVFRQQMQRQKNQLLQICRDSGGFQQVASDPGLVSSSERSVKQCLHQLQLLQKVWQPVLPTIVYYKSIGLLINSLIGELISEVVCLEDIPADSALQIISVLSVLTTNVPQLFSDKENASTLKALVMRSVRNWGRLEELMIVLGASMRDIEDRWASAKGPLASHFSVEDTKHLIRALFRNTDRRAKVLSRITI